MLQHQVMNQHVTASLGSNEKNAETLGIAVTKVLPVFSIRHAYAAIRHMIAGISRAYIRDDISTPTRRDDSDLLLHLVDVLVVVSGNVFQICRNHGVCTGNLE